MCECDREFAVKLGAAWKDDEFDEQLWFNAKNIQRHNTVVLAVYIIFILIKSYFVSKKPKISSLGSRWGKRVILSPFG